MRLLVPYRLDRGQLKRSTSIPRIDWSHPLARGLISYGYDAGNGPIDLVTRGWRTIGNATNPPFGGVKSSKYGIGLSSVATASVTLGLYNLPGGPVIESLAAAAPYTAACGLMLTATPVNQGFSSIFATCDATFNTPILMGAAYNGTTDYYFEFANTAPQPTALGAVKINQFQTLTAVALTSSTAACYVDGVLSISPAVTTTLAATSGARPSFHGLRNTAGQHVEGGFIYYGALWKGRALTAAEVRLLHSDPYCFLIYPEDEMWARRVPSSLVSGTLAATDITDIAALVGSVGVSGSLATTETPDVAALVGSVIVSGTLSATDTKDVVALTGSVGVSGSLATTESSDIAAFAGSVIVSGTLATTEATDTAAFSGGSAIAGTLAATGAIDVAAFAGSVTGIAGTLAATGAIDVAAFAGSVLVSGTLAATDTKDVAAFAGVTTTVSSGALAATDIKDVAVFAGNLSGCVGSFAVNEVGVGITNSTFPSNSAMGTPVGDLFVTGLDTAAFNGFVGVSGTLATTEAKDIASVVGTLPNVILGTLAVNEAGVSLDDNTFPPNSPVNTAIGTLSVVGIDTAVFNGAVGVNGTLVVTEATDTALFNGQVIPIGINGSLAVIEASDVATINGALGLQTSGTLAATEAKDVAVFAGQVVIAGQLAAIDAPDTVAVIATVGGAIGTLGVTEAPDVALFNGRVGTAGTLAATEAIDAAAFTGTLTGIAGTLVATEAKDVAAFNGLLTQTFGTLAATEGVDVAAFNGTVPLLELFGILSATETADAAYFVGTLGEEELQADFANWKFGKRFDRSLTCRFPWQG